MQAFAHTIQYASSDGARRSIHSFGSTIIIAIWEDYTYYEIQDTGLTITGTMTARMAHVLQSLLGNTSSDHNQNGESGG